MQTPESLSILTQVSEKSRRQVELTLSALARSTRKAIRQAEALDTQTEPTPAQRAAAWNLVNQRTETLCKLMAALTPAPKAVEQAEEKPQDIVAELEAEIQAIALLLPCVSAREQEERRARTGRIFEKIYTLAPEEHRPRLLRLAGAPKRPS